MLESIKNHFLRPYYNYKLSDVIMEFNEPLVIDIYKEALVIYNEGFFYCSIS